MKLTKEQFYARHANSSAWSALSKEEKKRRWKSYLASTSDKSTIPAPRPATQVIKGGPSGGQNKGKAAYTKLANFYGYRMNPRTHDFLTARCNPFCPRISNVGYPDAVPGGTVKSRGFARFTVMTNAAGYGYVGCSPSGLVSGSNYISYSASSAFTGAADQFPSSFAGPGQAATGFTGLPFCFGSSDSVFEFGTPLLSFRKEAVSKPSIFRCTGRIFG
jgi:hypothetical protein